ncbi:MAG: signal peptidase II [Cellvibrionaceae bacterium]|nr:signal peptidase II [Cellvibrionaceae bacterium]
MPDVITIKRKLPWLLFAIAAFIIVFDQATKHLALAYIEYLDVEPVTSFFYLTLRYNEGAAFSFLAGAGGWQRWLFATLAAVVSVVLVVWITRIYRQKGNTLEALALALILGGAVGNLYDRIMLGHVVDFIVFHYQEHEWPAFNIADSAICIGAALLVLDMFRGRKVTNE